MTPRKETEPTKEQREVARAIRKMIWDDDVAAFLARRDEARDAKWKNAVIDVSENETITRKVGDTMIGRCLVCRAFLTKFDPEHRRNCPVADLLASPSPASSEPTEDCPTCGGLDGCCLYPKGDHAPEQTEKKTPVLRWPDVPHPRRAEEAMSNQEKIAPEELELMDERDWPVYAVLLKTGELYWHDTSWGNRHGTGEGWLMVLPWGEQRERGGFHRGDNRFGIEHEDVSAFTLLTRRAPSEREKARAAVIFEVRKFRETYGSRVAMFAALDALDALGDA